MYQTITKRRTPFDDYRYRSIIDMVFKIIRGNCSRRLYSHNTTTILITIIIIQVYIVHDDTTYHILHRWWPTCEPHTVLAIVRCCCSRLIYKNQNLLINIIITNVDFFSKNKHKKSIKLYNMYL